MLGIIRVLTTDDKTRLNEHGDRLRELYNIQTISHCIEGQPEGVYDASSMSVAIPKLVRLARQRGADYPLKALTISCASDPGLKELRGVIRIPVFAAGGCSANISLAYGQRIGVIG